MIGWLMRKFNKHVTAGEGIGMRRLISLLNDLKIKHGVTRLTMNKMMHGDGKDRKYLLELYTK